METTARFDRATQKLYKDFHAGKLYAFSHEHCAVGNICDHDSSWSHIKHLPDELGDEFPVVKKTGYSARELLTMEKLFMHGVREVDYWTSAIDIGKPHNAKWAHPGTHQYHHLGAEKVKEIQFKGLEAVVEYLCELDNIPYGMVDTSKLFGLKDVAWDEAMFEKPELAPVVWQGRRWTAEIGDSTTADSVAEVTNDADAVNNISQDLTAMPSLTWSARPLLLNTRGWVQEIVEAVHAERT